MTEKYKSILRELNLTDADIAEMFGYKSAMAWYNSSAKERIEKGLVKFYEIVKSSE